MQGTSVGDFPTEVFVGKKGETGQTLCSRKGDRKGRLCGEYLVLRNVNVADMPMHKEPSTLMLKVSNAEDKLDMG